MTKSILFWLLATLFLKLACPPRRSSRRKIARIEYVSGVGDASDPGPEAFRQGARRK